MHELQEIADENTPLDTTSTSTSTPVLKAKNRPILVHQMSSLEMPVDQSTGMVKLHFWV